VVFPFDESISLTLTMLDYVDQMDDIVAVGVLGATSRVW
jgi:hypothetical protein